MKHSLWMSCTYIKSHFLGTLTWRVVSWVTTCMSWSQMFLIWCIMVTCQTTMSHYVMCQVSTRFANSIKSSMSFTFSQQPEPSTLDPLILSSAVTYLPAEDTSGSYSRLSQFSTSQAFNTLVISVNNYYHLSSTTP